MLNVGVIGYGYWGPNIARNFNDTGRARVVSISDKRREQLILAKHRYPGVETQSPSDLIHDPRIDIVAIATPVSTHFSLAMEAIKAGKHVWVEKPITETTDQASRLIDAAQRAGKVLAVDHTFIYTGAVRKIRELVANNSLGDIYYFDSIRVNLGIFQHDVNVVWDLAVHDLSILDYVLERRPLAVSATGMSHMAGSPENVAYLTVFFGDNLIAHVHANWLSPVKVRRTLIGGSNKMIVYDDLEPSEKVKVYDKGVTLLDRSSPGLYKALISYRIGDMWAPNLDTTEALRTEALSFIDCVEQGVRPEADGEAGLRVVRVLEAATESMRQLGHPVELRPGLS
jgi:predicted dehydrogenase